MPSHGGVDAALQAYFDAQIETALPGITVLHDNEGPLAPDHASQNPRTGEWLRFYVRHGKAEQLEVNTRASQNLGRVLVLIFVPLGTGTTRAHQIADAVVGLFQVQSIGGAHFQAAEEPGLGATPDNKWFQVTVSIPFWFEHNP